MEKVIEYLIEKIRELEKQVDKASENDQSVDALIYLIKILGLKVEIDLLADKYTLKYFNYKGDLVQTRELTRQEAFVIDEAIKKYGD